jgi:hypothetical protein
LKKYTWFFILLFFTLNFSFAQDFAKKGIWELGGSVSYTNNSFVFDGESDEINGFKIPSASTFLVNVPVYYFIADGWQIGLVPEYASLYLGNDDSDISASVFGIFLSTSYVFETGGSVYPFIEGKIGYSSANITIDGEQSGSGFVAVFRNSNNGQQTGELLDLAASGIGWGFSGGIKVQIAKGALINFAAGYQQRTLDLEENPEYGIPGDLDRSGINSIMVSLGFSVFLGK